MVPDLGVHLPDPVRAEDIHLSCPHGLFRGHAGQRTPDGFVGGLPSLRALKEEYIFEFATRFQEAQTHEIMADLLPECVGHGLEQSLRLELAGEEIVEPEDQRQVVPVPLELAIPRLLLGQQSEAVFRASAQTYHAPGFGCPGGNRRHLRIGEEFAHGCPMGVGEVGTSTSFPTINRSN